MVTGQRHSQQAQPLTKLNNQAQIPSYVSILQAQEQSSRAGGIALGTIQSQPAIDPLTMVKYRDPTKTILKPISQHQGKPAVHFHVSEKEALVKKLNLVLIGKFTHGRPSLSNIKVFFLNLKLQGVINVSLADSKHIFIECSNLSDFYWIWLNLSMKIHGFIMRIFKWGADFSPRMESPLAPVWVRIVGMPLYLFDEMSIWQISCAVGKPIRIDTRNMNRSVLSFARVCVELDISQKPTDTIWVCIKEENTDIIVESICLQVFYDVLPLYCTVCSHVGHGEDMCKKKMDKGSVADFKTDLNVESTSQKDHITASFAAASCSAPPQAVQTVWIPVKKSSTAVDLHSNHRFGRLNLQNEEVSKAIGKDPGAAQTSKTAATNVVELEAVLRNENENRPAAEKKGSTVAPLASENRFDCLNLQDGEVAKALDKAKIIITCDAKDSTVGIRTIQPLGPEMEADCVDCVVEPSIQKDNHSTAQVVAASCPTTCQVVTVDQHSKRTVWMPVSKGSTAAVLASENKLDGLNLQNGEVSKAFGKAEVNTSCEAKQPSWSETAATTVVENDAMHRNDEASTDQDSTVETAAASGVETVQSSQTRTAAEQIALPTDQIENGSFPQNDNSDLKVCVTPVLDQSSVKQNQEKITEAASNSELDSPLGKQTTNPGQTFDKRADMAQSKLQNDDSLAIVLAIAPVMAEVQPDVSNQDEDFYTVLQATHIPVNSIGKEGYSDKIMQQVNGLMKGMDDKAAATKEYLFPHGTDVTEMQQKSMDIQTALNSQAIPFSPKQNEQIPRAHKAGLSPAEAPNKKDNEEGQNFNSEGVHLTDYGVLVNSTTLPEVSPAQEWQLVKKNNKTQGVVTRAQAKASNNIRPDKVEEEQIAEQSTPITSKIQEGNKATQNYKTLMKERYKISRRMEKLRSRLMNDMRDGLRRQLLAELASLKEDYSLLC